MDVNKDLIGKTITGVVASSERYGGLCEIWLLQLSDGTHVEFVSPGARQALKRSMKQSLKPSMKRQNRAAANDLSNPQLRLNVA